MVRSTYQRPSWSNFLIVVSTPASMRLFLFAAGLVLSALFFASSTASAMDFTFAQPGGDKNILYMNGEINRGDYEKFRKFLLPNLDEFVAGNRVVMISSNGGDLIEALKIARIMRAMYLDISVPRDGCASSCFFLYLSGIHRTALIEKSLGIHRAYFDPTYFSGLSPSDADHNQAELSKIVKQYLEDYSVPGYLIDRMNRTSSGEIYWLSELDIEALGDWPPWYEEMLIAKCGYDKTIENRWLSGDKSLTLTSYSEYSAKVLRCRINKLNPIFRKYV